MTSDYPLLLAQHRAALDAQVSLLHQLEASSERQLAHAEVGDFAALAAENDHRDDLTRSLLAIEEALGPIRETLAAGRSAIEPLTAFAAVQTLHATTREMIARILITDRRSMKMLSDADLARRAALASLDRGETTLAAYRKVLAPAVASSRGCGRP